MPCKLPPSRGSTADGQLRLLRVATYVRLTASHMLILAVYVDEMSEMCESLLKCEES